MLALRTSPPSFSVAEGERIARDLYGLVGDLSSLSGERDCNFHLRTADGRERVLKILAPADPEGTDCLTRVLDHLAEQGGDLPVPRLLPTSGGEALGRVTRDGVAYAACLVSYLPGRLLADAYPDTADSARPRLLENLGQTLGRLDVALQGFFHPALTRKLAWDVRRLPDLARHSELIADPGVRRAVDTVAVHFHAALPRLRALRSQAIHGDCHATNVLIERSSASRAASAPTVSGILDFGDMIHGPVVLEPAVSLSELLTEGVAPLDQVGALLRGFARVHRLDLAEVEAVYDIVCARHAVTLLIHAFRTRHDPAGARLLDAAAARGAGSLDRLLQQGRERLSKTWADAAGAASGSARSVELGRRHRLMGKGAELFYEKPLHLVRGSGVWLYDPEGQAYLDVYNNVPHVGHSHPHVAAAIQRQVGVLATHSRYLHGGILEYAERLTARMPAHLDACLFVNSGSEANDVAWRLARLATGRTGALVMENAYHGITDAVAALTPSTGRPRDSRVVTLAPPPAAFGYEVRDAASHDRAALQAGAVAARDGALAGALADVAGALAKLDERGAPPAAFYIDTAITSSGVFDPPPVWGRAVSERIRAAGALIVADEVQYGLGRPGSHFWGFERRGIEPDIVTLGKPVANGYPMGVVVANRRLIEALQAEFGFFSTFGGNAVAAAAATAVLEVLDDEDLVQNAAQTGAYLRGRLEQIAARRPDLLGQVRGHGLLLGLEVLGADVPTARKRAKRIINLLASEKRILIGYEGPHATILKLRPPMPFRTEHADRLAEAIEEAAGTV